VTDADALVGKFSDMAAKSPQQIASLYDFAIRGLAE
jgi:hypothetical protein